VAILAVAEAEDFLGAVAVDKAHHAVMLGVEVEVRHS
jgi:hypothetical protein